MNRMLTVAALLIAAAPAQALEGVAYSGEAHALGGDALLYTEHHVVRVDQGAPVERYVLYRCPDGEAFARKHVVYGTPPFAPRFEQQDARFGYVEGFEPGQGSGEVFVRRSGDEARQQDEVDLGDSLVVDAGFDEFIRAEWRTLQQGRAVPLRFLVPSQLAAYGFKLRKTGEESLFGDTASNYHLALSGLFGWFVDGIDVSYRNSDRRLMRFAGLSNIRSSPTENLQVAISFPPEREHPLDEQSWAEAQRAPLTACALGG